MNKATFFAPQLSRDSNIPTTVLNIGYHKNGTNQGWVQWEEIRLPQHEKLMIEF